MNLIFKKINLNLKGKLLLPFLTLIIASFLLITLTLYHIGKKNLEQKTGKNMRNTAVNIIGKINNDICEMGRDLYGWADLEFMNDILIEDVDLKITKFLKKMKGERFKEISCIDVRGRIIASTDPMQIGRRIKIEKIRSKKDTMSTQINYAKIQDNISIAISCPVFSKTENKEIGYLVAFVDWGRIQKSIDLKKVEGREQSISRFILLMDKQGEIIYSPKHIKGSDSLLKGFKKANLDSIEQTIKGECDYLTDRLANGNEYLISYTHAKGHSNSGGIGWSILVFQDTKEAFSMVENLRNWIIIIASITIIITGLVIVVIAKNITDPIKRIALATEKIRRREWSGDIDIKRDDEIGILANNFNSMHKAVNDYSVNLEKKVEEIRKSEEKFRNLFESSNDAIILADSSSGNIIDINKRAELLFGYTRDEFLKMHVSQLYPEEQRKLGKEMGKEVLKRGALRTDASHLKKNGDVIFVDISFSSITYKDKKVVQAVINDITEKKRLQQQLLQSEKMAAVGLLVSGVAHELNNPLTAVLGFSELIMKKDIDEKVKNSISRIHSSAQRCKRIVENLLTFARQHKPQKTCIEINEIINNTLELKAYDMQVNNINIIKEFNSDLPITIADFHQLQQVFLNIINNAEHAMLKAHGKGVLRIRTEVVKDSQENFIKISFIDDGPGIPQENLNRIFNPFFTTKNVGEGTGLGLSISYGIIEEHEGRIYAESQDGNGAIFIIELPILEGEKCMNIKKKLEGASVQNLKNKRILIIDDEKEIINFLLEIFKEWNIVDTALNGISALEKLEKMDYDLIISDIKMPEMDGIMLYETIKKIKPHLLKRFIFITGDNVNLETRNFFDNLPNHYLEKPFTIDDINRIINRVQ